jgi:hypothetical protein
MNGFMREVRAVEAVFEARRDAFSARRIDGARKMKGVRWGGLVSMRDLRG